MRRKEPVYRQVYKKLLLPTPEGDNYAIAWTRHVQTNLLPEVRFEVTSYYGDLSSVEARFPGLNYHSKTARRRLRRFQHHKRLFRAFDELGLTEGEIFELCNWEGTAFVKAKYERDNKTKIRDTTCDDIITWEEAQERRERAAILAKADRLMYRDATRHTTTATVAKDDLHSARHSTSGRRQLNVHALLEEEEEAQEGDADEVGDATEDVVEDGQEDEEDDDVDVDDDVEIDDEGDIYVDAGDGREGEQMDWNWQALLTSLIRRDEDGLEGISGLPHQERMFIQETVLSPVLANLR